LQAFGPGDQQAAQRLLEQARGMMDGAKEPRDQIQAFGNSGRSKPEDFMADPALTDQLGKQAEALGYDGEADRIFLSLAWVRLPRAVCESIALAEILPGDPFSWTLNICRR
jgi:hypothetical protein